jgi:hypothetical protein
MTEACCSADAQRSRSLNSSITTRAAHCEGKERPSLSTNSGTRTRRIAFGWPEPAQSRWASGTSSWPRAPAPRGSKRVSVSRGTTSWSWRGPWGEHFKVGGTVLRARTFGGGECRDHCSNLLMTNGRRNQKRYRTPFTLQVPEFAEARKPFCGGRAVGCTGRQRPQSPRPAGWFGVRD